jgi:predicted transcriptional regulator
VDRLFEGSLANAVCHLLETNQASREEIDRIEKLVKDAKRRAE